MKRRNFLTSTTAFIAGGFASNLYGQISLIKGNIPTDVHEPMLNSAEAEFLNNATETEVVSKRIVLCVEQETQIPGYVPADGMQQWLAIAQCESMPEQLVAAHDCGGIWISYDYGKKWRLPLRNGLHTNQTNGIEVDPLDPKRIFVMAGGSWPRNINYEGLYLSVDGGMNFKSKVIKKRYNNRETFSAITFAPSTKDYELQKTKRWYCFSPSATQDDIPIYMSDNYGESFTTVRSISKTTYGKIFYARVHPTNSSLVYTIGLNGLLRFSNAHLANGEITQMSGQNGLPAGEIHALPYISADGNTIILGVKNVGIFKTVNACGSWTRIGTEANFFKLWVNPWNTDHMILTYGDSQGSMPKFSKNGGVTFTSASYMQKRPVFGDLSSSRTRNKTQIAFHPDAGKAYLTGGQMWANYRSEDYGANWDLSFEGFSGAQFRTISSPQMFDAVDKNRILLPMIDVGPWITTNGGKWFHPRHYDRLAMGFTTVPTQVNCALHPANRDIMLTLQDSGDYSQYLCGTFNEANSWVKLVAEEGKGAYLCFDPADPSYAFWSRYRSNNHGRAGSWSQMSSLPSGWELWAGSLWDPAGISLYAVELSSLKKFRRSLDRGETWPLALEMPHDVMSGSGRILGVTVGHPLNRNVLFTRGNPKHTIWKWDFSSQTPTYSVLNVFGPGGSLPAMGTPFDIDKLAIDRRYPDVMYVCTLNAGTKYRLFRTTNGGLTAWENISHLIPICSDYHGLEVSPLTGDMIISGSNGMFIIPPPYAQEGTLTSSLTIENYLQNEPWTYPTHVSEVDAIFKKKVKVSPNPFRKRFSVDLGEVYQKISLEINDSAGRMVYNAQYTRQQFIEVHLNEPSGVYFMSIRADNEAAVIKLINNAD